MSRRLLAVALLTALVLLGGCLSGAPGTDSPSETDSPTTTDSPRPNTDCPYVLSVDEAGAASGDRIDYADLPADRQREFDRALAEGEYELGETLPATWSEPRIVEYEGTEYYASASVC